MGRVDDEFKDDEITDLTTLLALAHRELAFLRADFTGRPEVAGCATGEEFLESLQLALIAIRRLMLETSTPNYSDDHPLHAAIAAMNRDKS